MVLDLVLRQTEASSFGVSTYKEGTGFTCYSPKF